MSQIDAKLEEKAVNTIRMLAADMVEEANSGHPGMPLGAAPMAYVLWTRFLKHNPADPAWPDRDRFILSAGHGSALLYSLLHLTGYDLPLSEIRNFRQWGSKTPGHPEHGMTSGVECTTGPLGMGFSMGVGMALAEKFLAGRYNAPGSKLVDHYTYAIVSDGDLMEGVAAEAASLAGTLGLGKLIYLYDDNSISIEGCTDLAFSENVVERFDAYGWHTLTVADGADLAAVEAAIHQARSVTGQPSLIAVKTRIGACSPKENMASAHGEPLGTEALAQTRKTLSWPEERFHIPGDVLAFMRSALDKGARDQALWQASFDARQAAEPQTAKSFLDEMAGRLPEGWEAALPRFAPGDGPVATRVSQGKVLNALAKVLPNLMGGSADLSPSTKTVIADSPDVRPINDPIGRNIHFGVREHGMGAVVNGMALHGGVIPYGATFFVFSDFLRPALRMAAIQECRSIFVFTHDSIGVGEDGPTHQPVEQLMSLRLIPGLSVIRPADANECAGAWAQAVAHDGPTVMVFSRQNLPILDPDQFPTREGVAKGGYVLSDCQATPDIILMGSGSEVHLCLAAQAELKEKGVAARVVSLPSWDLFAKTGAAYKESVLPSAVKARLAVEAGATLGWERYVGDAGRVIGLDRFGASAPGKVVQEKLGFTPANVVKTALEILGR